MSENIKQMKTHNKGNLLINRSTMLYIFNTKEFMLDFIEYVTNLQDQLQQKENILKEVREYIKDNSAFLNDDEWEVFNKKEIYEILDKVEENK